MSLTKLSLIRPHAAYRDSFLAGLRELTEADRTAWVYLAGTHPLSFPEQDFTEYVNTLLQRLTHPPPPLVPDMIYWVVFEDDIVGRISLRLRLNDSLRQVGGNIGYIVRPSFRKRGFASEMLKQILETPEAIRIGRLLLTCDENNLASEKSILKNGGVLENLLETESNSPRKKRFWIQLPKIAS